MTTYVALLYSIVLTKARRVVMADLKAVADGLGYANPRTVFATGNLVFEAPEQSVSKIESALETACAKVFGKHIDIIVRTAEGWRQLLAGNPFGGEDGSQLIVRVMRRPVTSEAMEALRARVGGEQIAERHGDVWVRFAGKASESRLLGLLTSQKMGTGTLRNLNTVRKIADIL